MTEDYNSCDQNTEIGYKLCISVGINPELLQFLSLQSDSLQCTLMINIFFDTDLIDSIKISILKFCFFL